MEAGLFTALNVWGDTAGVGRDMAEAAAQVALGRAPGARPARRDWQRLEAAIDRMEHLSEETREQAKERLRELKAKREDG